MQTRYLHTAMTLIGAASSFVASAETSEPLLMTQITAVGTHNSYKAPTPPETIARLRQESEKAALAKDYAHRPVAEQLAAGGRAFEFDVNYDPKGGHFASLSSDPRLKKPGFKVMHIPGIDDNTNCMLLSECLRDIRTWSDAHPDHAPILIMFNSMDEQNAATDGVDALPFDERAYDALDHEVVRIFGKDKIITPSEVQGSYPTLRDAVLAHNWPNLTKARGRVLFALDDKPDKIAAYRGKRKSLEGRMAFVNTDMASPAAAYLTINDPIGKASQIADAVSKGFLVRTRADASTFEARSNDTRRRKAAFASGAQYILTDYLFADPRFPGGYSVGVPGGRDAMCNPKLTRDGCKLP